MFTTGPDYLRFLVHSLANDHRMFEPQARIDDDLASGTRVGHRSATGVRPSGSGATTQDTRTSSSGGRRTDRVSSSSPTVTVVRCVPDVVRHLLPGTLPRWTPAAGRAGCWPWPDARWTSCLGSTSPLSGHCSVLTGRGDDGQVDRIADRYRQGHGRLLGLVVEKSWEVQDMAAGTPIACHSGWNRATTETRRRSRL